MFSPAPRTEASWSEDTPSQEYKSSPGRARILLLSPHSFVSPRRTQHNSSNTTKRSLRAAAKFDIVSYLPSEIAVTIFQLLSPADLCNVCQVSQRWSVLSGLGGLDKIRRRFLRQAREKYSENKENSTQLPTPHLLRSSCSPLTLIQSSSIQRYRTPSPGPPVEAVGGLAICDHEIRRCLFPGQPPPPIITEPDTIGKKANKHRLKRL
ncbi:uncharacterized protein LOC135339432 [Halichondria panicea]|uniref:uncharacterized protein LOC135339432 n=1 Tax=Halichondria panicea TaxID=6063 RepID=UPI00312B4753